MGPYSFVINGLLRAEGTEGDSIVFTTDTLDNPDRWRSIQFISADDSSRLSYCIIENSSAPVAGPAEGGGGMRIQACDMVVSHCTIRNNTCAQSGGGVAICLGNHARLEHCLIIDNNGPYGGGIACNGTPTFDNCVIARNFAGQGGGIGCWAASPTITNCTIMLNRGNDASGVRGSSSFPSLSNVLFACNYPGPAIGLYDGSALDEFGYCDFYDQLGGLVEGPPIPGFGDFAQFNGNGDSCDIFFNIFIDPAVVDTSQDDYSLLPESPCIDAGDPTPPFEPDGTIRDIGANFDFTTGLIVVSPNGSESWETESTDTIRWTDEPFEGTVRIELNCNYPSGPWEVIAVAAPDDGIDTLAVTGPASSHCRVRVSSNFSGMGDVSDADFAIVPSARADPTKLLPTFFAMHPVYPNPFNSSTRVSYDVPVSTRVSLKVYNVLGEEVASLVDAVQAPGSHTVLFDGAGLPSGEFICRMQVDGYSFTQRMLLLK
jgi:hypothetical protein